MTAGLTATVKGAALGASIGLAPTARDQGLTGSRAAPWTMTGATLGPIRRASVRDCRPGEYVGRGSPLGNPYRVREHGRRRAVALYRRWMWAQIQAGDREVMAELNRLLRLARRPQGVALLCWCREEELCHGDTVRSALRWLHGLIAADPLLAFACDELGAEVGRYTPETDGTPGPAPAGKGRSSSIRRRNDGLPDSDG